MKPSQTLMSLRTIDTALTRAREAFEQLNTVQQPGKASQALAALVSRLDLAQRHAGALATADSDSEG